MDPNKIDLEVAQAECISFAGTGDDGRTRWTELSVYYLHRPPSSGRRWLSQSVGRTLIEGERDRVRRLNVGSLERALKLFEQSDIGVIVIEQARDWAEEQKQTVDHIVQARAKSFGVSKPRVVVENIGHADRSIVDAWDATLDFRGNDKEALEYLYGNVDSTPRATFASMFARDFGIAPRTVQVALKENTPIRVPLRSILRFFDRDAFRAWRPANRGTDNA